jgi:hypothetical protein
VHETGGHTVNLNVNEGFTERPMQTQHGKEKPELYVATLVSSICCRFWAKATFVILGKEINPTRPASPRLRPTGTEEKDANTG